MLLLVEDDHKKHLQFLTGFDPNVFAEFCRIAVEFILKGSNLKIYQNAAQKLGEDPEVIQHAVQGLMFLFIESTKLMLNDLDFQDSVLALGFSGQLQQELLRHYKENMKDIRSVLSDLDCDLPHYHGLEWRCDVQLASRSLHQQMTPVVTLKLTTEQKGHKSVSCLQTDITNLVHLTDTLDQALQEVKSQHCQRIQRHIK